MATVAISTVEAPVALSATVASFDLLIPVAVGTVTAPVSLSATVTSLAPIKALAGEIMAPIKIGGIARPTATPALDPRTGSDQWRYVVTDLQGVPLGELTDIEHEPVAEGVNEPTTMPFTIAMTDPARALIKPVERQCEVWEGKRLLLRGPILAGNVSDDGATVTHVVHDPSWWWRGGRKRIGRVPTLNLLTNGSFTSGLNGWTGGYDTGSIPAASPDTSIVSDDWTNGGKAAQIKGVESVTQTTSELASNAVYWPNRPFVYEPLSAGFRPGGAASVDAVATAMPATAGLKVTITGHTANDGTGDGMALSLRRAQAAAARVAAIRPGAVITTRGVGYHDPKPGFPIDSQEQRRVVIAYAQTVTVDAKAKQWIRQTVTVTQPKTARYALDLVAAAWVKITDDWSVQDANMVTVRIVARRSTTPGKIWQESSASVSDTDPVERWLKQSATVTIPPDGRPYLVDVYLYAPAAAARYTQAVLEPQEVLYFWGTDQALIVKGVIEHMQDPITMMGRTWPITIGTRTPQTGVTRDRPYRYSDRTPVDTALEEFPSLFHGLDIDTLTTPTEATVATFYPRQGSVLDYVLVQGGNVAGVTPASTNDVGSLVIAQAQDTSGVRDEAYALDASAFGGMILQRLITAEQETPISELDETANAELAWAKVATPAYWLDIDPERIPEVLAETGKGDTVRLILDFPDAVDRLARIVKRERHPNGLRLMVTLEA
ncbi:MAG: hypothetical protein JWP31_153 [Aeromicrobium sp.]|nr:hypothetical protein [Aeromicrobium sp.]